MEIGHRRNLDKKIPYQHQQNTLLYIYIYKEEETERDRETERERQKTRGRKYAKNILDLKVDDPLSL